jgi:hypothetical protein
MGMNGISLILPYWDRQEAADKALALLEKHYAALDLEVIVVDDGSPVPFQHTGFNPDARISLRVVRLPEKTHAKATCVPLNRGVEAATNKIIALSGVEMLHHKHVLTQMRDTLLDGDNNTYVSAAVYQPDTKRWHAHSSLKRAPLNFMTMLHRDLWNRAGGMDEDYREGIAFDDNDFVMRLERAGMHYVIRDDLVVEHPRKGAKAVYTIEQHERNRRLFLRKWSDCTQAA